MKFLKSKEMATTFYLMEKARHDIYIVSGPNWYAIVGQEEDQENDVN